MNCFYHADKAAVGVCKACGRGICADCAADIGDAIACKGRCEAKARVIVESFSNTVKTANTQLRRNMWFSLASGVLFICLGCSFGDATFAVIFVLLGIVFILRGIFSYTRRARYQSRIDPV